MPAGAVGYSGRADPGSGRPIKHLRVDPLFDVLPAATGGTVPQFAGLAVLQLQLDVGCPVREGGAGIPCGNYLCLRHCLSLMECSI